MHVTGQSDMLTGHKYDTHLVTQFALKYEHKCKFDLPRVVPGPLTLCQTDGNPDLTEGGT